MPAVLVLPALALRPEIVVGPAVDEGILAHVKLRSRVPVRHSRAACGRRVKLTTVDKGSTFTPR